MTTNYPVVVAEDIAITGDAPNHEWEAFLSLVCAAGLWESVQPLVRFTAAADDPESFRGMDPTVLDQVPLSRGERLVLQAALHLYNPRNPPPALSNLAATLDDRHYRHYEAMLAAMAEFRARIRQPQ